MSQVMEEEIKTLDSAAEVSVGAGDHPGQDDSG
jgi:hypothetical protein